MTDKNEYVVTGQDRLLLQLQRAAIPVAIYLKNGIKLQGKIVKFDSHVILLRGPTAIVQMIYKQAVLTIQP